MVEIPEISYAAVCRAALNMDRSTDCYNVARKILEIWHCGRPTDTYNHLHFLQLMEEGLPPKGNGLCPEYKLNAGQEALVVEPQGMRTVLKIHPTSQIGDDVTHMLGCYSAVRPFVTGYNSSQIDLHVREHCALDDFLARLELAEKLPFYARQKHWVGENVVMVEQERLTIARRWDGFDVDQRLPAMRGIAVKMPGLGSAHVTMHHISETDSMVLISDTKTEHFGVTMDRQWKLCDGIPLLLTTSDFLEFPLLLDRARRLKENLVMAGLDPALSADIDQLISESKTHKRGGIRNALNRSGAPSTSRKLRAHAQRAGR